MSFSPMPYGQFVGHVSRFMTYECDCNCAAVDGHLPCLGGCTGKYLSPDALVAPQKTSRPKKQQKFPEKIVPPTPYQRRDALLSKWYDEYVRDQHFDISKKYVWVHRSCRNCINYEREQAFRPELEAMRVQYRKDLELMILRKEKEDREKKAKQTELELLRAEKRARETVDELEFASDEDVVYDWVEKDDQ